MTVQRLQTSFVWQFAGGFVLGVLGLILIQPAERTEALVCRFVPSHYVR